MSGDEWSEESSVRVGHEEGSAGKHEQTEQVRMICVLCTGIVV